MEAATRLAAPLGKGVLSYVRIAPEPEAWDEKDPDDAFTMVWTDGSATHHIMSVTQLQDIPRAHATHPPSLSDAEALSLARMLAVLLGLGPVVYHPALYAPDTPAGVTSRLFTPRLRGQKLEFVAEHHVGPDLQLTAFASLSFDLTTFHHTSSVIHVPPPA